MDKETESQGMIISSAANFLGFLGGKALTYKVYNGNGTSAQSSVFFT